MTSTKPPRSSNIIQSKFSVVEYLNTLKEKVSSKVWSDRYEICTKVIQVIKDQFGKLENSLSTPISPTHLMFTDSELEGRTTSDAEFKNAQVASKGVCEIFTQLLSDSHYKVQMKCQSALYLLLWNIEKFEPEKRDRIIPSKLFEELHAGVLTNLTDKRKEVNEGALQIIDRMRGMYCKDFLAVRTLSVLDIKNSRAKIASFEFLASIVKDTQAFIADSKVLKKCIKKCMFYLNQNSKDTNFIGPILSILLWLRDMNWGDTVKILTSGGLSYAESETLDRISAKYAPDLMEDIAEFKKKQVQKPVSGNIDRSKFWKSIDQVPKEVLLSDAKLQFKSKDFSDSMNLADFSNFTSDGYCSISLKNRVNNLKKIAMRHIKSQSEER